MSKLKIPVAKYLTQQVAVCGKNQREIATDLGYTNPNVITMFKTGATKIPVNKVPALAKTLGVDPLFLLRAVMSEYMPETWEAIEQTIGTDKIVTEDERALLKVIRSSTGGIPLDMTIPEHKEALVAALKDVTKKTNAKNEASLARYLSLPANVRSK